MQSYKKWAVMGNCADVDRNECLSNFSGFLRRNKEGGRVKAVFTIKISHENQMGNVCKCRPGFEAVFDIKKSWKHDDVINLCALTHHKAICSPI